SMVLEDVGEEPTPELVERMLRTYEEKLPARVKTAEGGRLMPRVRAILEHLEGREEVLNLLLTGNTETGAAAKLGHFGIDRFFSGGAFSVDAAPREEIARRGRALAAEILGREPDDEHVYVIGDTEHDVRCGKAIGARTIALGTGPNTDRAAIEAAGPWTYLDELPEPDQFERLVGLSGSSA
ncbi:MAG: haloacid dehalogenase-like hydrolase, partial [Thermoleophilaceae bacterium]|nr:haloacid dehalogenase-like hydrolase [Thermoleophilaceae bacterium]